MADSVRRESETERDRVTIYDSLIDVPLYFIEPHVKELSTWMLMRATVANRARQAYIRQSAAVLSHWR